MSKAQKSEAIEDGYTNAFWNILQPYTAGGKYVMGSLTYVAIETLVGQAVRKVMSSPLQWRESALTHAISVPFLGQLNFGEPFGDIKFDPEDKVELMKEATDGAKAIPAALVGFTATKLLDSGFKIPKFATKELVALCIGKIISRPITAYMASSLPKDIQVGLQVLNELANRQREVAKAPQTKVKGGSGI